MIHELKITIDSVDKAKLAKMKEVMLEALNTIFKDALCNPEIKVHALIISYDHEVGYEVYIKNQAKKFPKY